MKLQKKTYLTSEADKLIDRSFSEIGKTVKTITVEGFFKTYKDIFFKIPKRGVNSHTTLYEESGEFIENPKTRKAKKTTKLNQNIQELQSKISELQHKNEMLSSINVSQELELKELKAQS